MYKEYLIFFKAKVGEVTLPESFDAYVKDTVDGDTIIIRYTTKEIGDYTLDVERVFEFEVRLVGINAPEKHDKGAIHC